MVTNLFSPSSQQSFSIALPKQTALISPKTGNTKREISEVTEGALSGRGATNNDLAAQFQKGHSRILLHKSLSLEKSKKLLSLHIFLIINLELVSPKGSEGAIRLNHQEEVGSLSARKHNFPVIQSPTSKKNKVVS